MSFLPKGYKHSHFHSRLTSIRTAYEGLDTAIRRVIQQGEKMEEENHPGFDWEDASLICEELYGAAFVVAQSFLRGEFTDISKESRVLVSKNFQQYLSDFSNEVGSSGVSQLELSIALANCYKHGGEWSRKIVAKKGFTWSTNEGEGKYKTIKTLQKVGIDGEKFFPCSKGVHIMTAKHDDDFFKNLYNDLVGWRNGVAKLDGGPAILREWH